ncbi:uncharacterized protein LOC131043017 [Cryptomeria japonica]|nr:uncharacterized protein LOC131043017 [Cryptomeria japonica]
MRLDDFASIWWKLEEEKIGLNINTVSWEIFLERFRARFLSPQWRQTRADEFYSLRQFGMSVDQFEHRFYELKQYAGIGNDEAMLVQHFLRGLNDRISGGVRVFEPVSVEAAVAKARLVEQNLIRAHGGQAGVQIGSVPSSGNRARGNQSQSAAPFRTPQAPAKGGQQQQPQQQPQQQKPKQSQGQQGGNPPHRRNRNWRRSKQGFPGQSSQSASQAPSRGSFQQSSGPTGGRGPGRGACYSCGQYGHIAVQCPQRIHQTGNQGPVASEPTVGDAGRTHRVFAAVDNRQAEHQGTVIEAAGRGRAAFYGARAHSSASGFDPQGTHHRPGKGPMGPK